MFDTERRSPIPAGALHSRRSVPCGVLAGAPRLGVPHSSLASRPGRSHAINRYSGAILGRIQCIAPSAAMTGRATGHHPRRSKCRTPRSGASQSGIRRGQSRVMQLVTTAAVRPQSGRSVTRCRAAVESVHGAAAERAGRAPKGSMGWVMFCRSRQGRVLIPTRTFASPRRRDPSRSPARRAASRWRFRLGQVASGCRVGHVAVGSGEVAGGCRQPFDGARLPPAVAHLGFGVPGANVQVEGLIGRW